MGLKVLHFNAFYERQEANDSFTMAWQYLTRMHTIWCTLEHCKKGRHFKLKLYYLHRPYSNHISYQASCPPLSCVEYSVTPMWVSLNTSRLLLLLLPLLSLEVPVGACVEYQHKNLKTVAYLLFLLLLPFSWGTPELHVSRHATLTTSLILRTENTYHLGVPGTRPHSSRSLLPLGEYHILSLEEAAETGPEESSHYIVLAQDLIQNLYMSIKKK